jgi:hypothetical protein
MALLARTCAIAAMVVVFTFLPFVPGGYDPLAGPVSAMAWVAGRVGLVLVPIGLLWLRLKPRPRWLAHLTAAACGLIAVVMVLIAFASGVVLAMSTAMGGGVLIGALVRRLRSASTTRASRTAAVLLAASPIVVVAAQTLLAEPVSTWARNRVIGNAAPLIAEIERYRARRGAYPESLFANHDDYKTSIAGVERYHYERHGGTYNVIFAEPSLAGFGTRRFVVYNPRDTQRVTVHEQDRLLLDDAGLDADNAGYTGVQPLPQPHWKVFLFLS